MRIVLVNYVYAQEVRDPDQLLGAYPTLTAWSDALLGAGASEVTVAQRFARDADFTRRGVRYVFRADGGGPWPRPWTRSRALHRAIVAASPDVTHVNGLVFPLQVRRLRRTLPGPTALVVQDHAGRSPGRSLARTVGPAARIVYRRGLGLADAVFFTAVEQATPWRDAGFLPAMTRVATVPESSTTLRPIARGAARAATGLVGQPSVLWVGRLTANKDPLTVLAGFERAVTRLPGGSLTMAYGSDELGGEVERRIQSSPLLVRRVRTIGRVPHERLAEYYSAADLFVSGSHHEGSGYALIEAMACGAFPVVTGIPSFRALTGEKIGVMWEPGNAASLAPALIEAAGQIGDATRAAVRAHFDCVLSWPVIARQALAAYRDAIARRRFSWGVRL